MSSTLQDSIKSNKILIFQFSLSVGVLLLILSWVFNISFWKSMTLVLAVLVALLLFAVTMLVDRLERLEKSRKYRLTRIYNKDGQEVMNRWTDQFNPGHWVTITTDVVNHDVLYAEHTRTDENINLVGREKCAQEEHEYNRSAVWGEHYKGPEYRIKIEI